MNELRFGVFTTVAQVVVKVVLTRAAHVSLAKKLCFWLIGWFSLPQGSCSDRCSSPTQVWFNVKL